MAQELWKKARENFHAGATICFGFTCGARTLNQSLSEAMPNQSNSLITFDTQLKTALNLNRFVYYSQISLQRVADNGYKQYVKSRPCASSESVKRSKTINVNALPIHPLFSKFSLMSKSYLAIIHLPRTAYSWFSRDVRKKLKLKPLRFYLHRLKDIDISTGLFSAVFSLFWK